MSATNLSTLYNKSACYCLNEDSVCSHINLFDGEGSQPLKSNADEQLLLHLEFNQTVKLVSITFGLPGNDESPKTVKLFMNKNNLGFDEATDATPVQTISLAPSSSQSSVSVPLVAAKWQRTESISIFVVDNHGAPVSCLQHVRIYGMPIDSVDVSKIHDQGHHH